VVGLFFVDKMLNILKDRHLLHWLCTYYPSRGLEVMFDRNFILDENGEVKAVELWEWAEWFENNQNRTIAFTKLDDCDISTVFLGLNHNWVSPPKQKHRVIDEDWEVSQESHPDVPDWTPILFETMIFGGPYNESQWRYRTKKAAEAHHAKLVEILKAGGDPNTEEFIL
jgi:hypothetical protein